MFVTRARVDSWRTAAGLQPADDPLLNKVDDVVAAMNAAPFNGRVNEANNDQATALATAAGLSSVSDLYIVLKWGAAAGVLVKVG